MDGSRATSDLNVRGEPRIRSRFDTTTTAVAVLASMDQGGKRALVTRGAGGIGADCGAVRVSARRLDPASLAQVRGFAVERGAGGEGRDILIKNAGVMDPPLTRTAEGHELQFGINLLGHSGLTRGLMPMLRAGGRAGGQRVVNRAPALGHPAGRFRLSYPSL